MWTGETAQNRKGQIETAYGWRLEHTIDKNRRARDISDVAYWIEYVEPACLIWNIRGREAMVQIRPYVVAQGFGDNLATAVG
jgi:hypothetical protein